MIAFAITMTLYIGLLAILDHIGLRTQLNDLGHAEQAIWQATQGNFSMPLTDPVMFLSRFTTHANIIYYIVAIPYFFFKSPITLLVISALAFGAAGISMYFLANTVCKNKTIALVLGSAMLLTPMIQETALYDFHAIILAIPLLILTLLCMEKKRWIIFWVFASLLLMIKEDMPLLLIAFSPLIFLRGSRKHAIMLVIVSITYWLAVTHGTAYFFGTRVADEFIFTRYAYLGDSANEILLNAILEPQRWMEIAGAGLRKRYILYLFMQGGYLAIFSPIALLGSIPNFAQNVMSAAYLPHAIAGTYHSGIILLTIYIGCVYTFRKLKPRLRKIVLSLFVVQVLLITIVMSPMPYGKFSTWKDYMPVHNTSRLREMLSLIPKDAAVAAQNNLGAHLASRDIIVKRPEFFDYTDYIVLNVQIPVSHFNDLMIRSHAMIVGHTIPIYNDFVKEMFEKEGYGILYYMPPFYLFKKGYPQTMNAIAEINALRDLTYFRYCENNINAALGNCPNAPLSRKPNFWRN